MFEEPFTVASVGLLGADFFTTAADGYLLGDADLVDVVSPFPAISTSTLVATAASATFIQSMRASSTLEPTAESLSTSTQAESTTTSSPQPVAQSSLVGVARSKSTMH
jgi:hypothetical protein